MRGQFGGKTFMVGRVHEYQVEMGITLLDEHTCICLDDGALFPGVYDFEVSLDHLCALFCLLDKGNLGGTPAYSFYPEAAASSKEVQNHSIIQIVDEN